MDFERLAAQYVGDRAKKYEAERTQGRIWKHEQNTVQSMLSRLQRGARIIDVPVGTGRFFPLYREYGLVVTGVDISDDMLGEARKKAQEQGTEIVLHRGDIRNLPAEDNSFDAAICIRFLNWVSLESVKLAITELVRVSRDSIILGVRHFTPPVRLSLQGRSGLRRLQVQMYRRIQQGFQKQGLVCHSKRQLENTFSQNGLEIVERTCVDQRYDGTDYFIYHFRK